MKRLLRQLEELGIVLRRNLSNVVSSVRLRLTILYTIIATIALFFVDFFLNQLRIFTFIRTIEGIIPDDVPYELVIQAYEATMHTTRTMDYGVLLLSVGIIAALSYKVAGMTLSPVTRAIEAHRRFIVNAAHELRTPLSVMNTEVEVTVRNVHTSTTADMTKTLNSMREEIQTMNEILSNLSLIAHVYTGKQPTRASFDIRDTVSMASERALQRAVGKGVMLDVVIADQPIVVTANETALLQILQNIIQNAIKYTPEGGTVSVYAYPHKKYAAITVSDTGVGMTVEDRARIFEPFYRGEHVRHIEGTGLGLTLVHELIKIHEGKLVCSSTPGKGTVMTVYLRIST